MSTSNPYDREDTCRCSAWSEGECACGGYVDPGKKRAWASGYAAAIGDAIAALRGEGQPGHPGEFIAVNEAEDIIRELGEAT